MRALFGALGLVCTLCLSAPAQAFSIGSSITDYCHERITYSAFQRANPLPERLGSGLEAARKEAFVLFGDYLADRVGVTMEDDFDRLVITSLFVGVRYPDQGAFSTFDLDAMRSIHLDQGHQAGHFLRDIDHDGAGADALAVEGGRQFIVEHIEELIQEVRQAETKLKVVRVEFYLEFYGAVELEVWEPLFKLGEVVHAFEDSFAHAVRTEDGRQIISVANFVEPLMGEYEESRDGPPHSNILDECNDPQVTGHTEMAIEATAELFAAVRQGIATGEMTAVEVVMDDWMTYAEGCDHGNAYCDSDWAKLGASDPTTPPLGCSSTGPFGLALLLLPLCLLAGRRPGLRHREGG